MHLCAASGAAGVLNKHTCAHAPAPLVRESERGHRGKGHTGSKLLPACKQRARARRLAKLPISEGRRAQPRARASRLAPLPLRPTTKRTNRPGPPPIAHPQEPLSPASYRPTGHHVQPRWVGGRSAPVGLPRAAAIARWACGGWITDTGQRQGGRPLGMADGDGQLTTPPPLAPVL